MAGFGAETRRYMKRLQKAGVKVREIVIDAAKTGTMAAVETAAEHTPPNGGAPIRGVNTRTGEMAQAWATDSITQPMGLALSGGGTAVTMLRNNLQYASYVNDGHRMDKHFTTHVAIENGMLVGKPDGTGGLVVGTKTSYVPGLYMKEKANGKYKTTVRYMLQDAVRRAMSE